MTSDGLPQEIGRPDSAAAKDNESAFGISLTSDFELRGKTPIERRAGRLDVLSAILPAGRREQLASLLTDKDVATLRHLARQGLGKNTLKALVSDLGYLEAWAQVATGAPLPWPAAEDLVLKFIAHHLYDPAERERDRTHGMPTDVVTALTQERLLRTDGPHAASTVKRRLAIWATLHRWRGFDAPMRSPNIRNAMRLASRASDRLRGRKSPSPVTRDILDQLLATCDSGKLVDLRDRAILLVGFGSGGRRRSEIARLRVEDLIDRQPVAEDAAVSDGPRLPVMAINLGRTKTADAADAERVILIGRPVDALKTWLAAATIWRGPVFRAIDRFDRVGLKALDGQSINLIIKKRCAMAGLSKALYSAHGLRSGYLTEAARRGVPLQEAMRQSRHRSVQQAADYYNEVDLERGNAGRLG